MQNIVYLTSKEIHEKNFRVWCQHSIISPTKVPGCMVYMYVSLCTDFVGGSSNSGGHEGGGSGGAAGDGGDGGAAGDGGDGGDRGGGGGGDKDGEGENEDEGEDKETKAMAEFLDMLNNGFWKLYVLRCSNPAVSPVINPGLPGHVTIT